jgi:hypothetical protein
VPNYTFSLSLTYATTVFDDYKLSVRLTDNYVGPSVDESYSPIIELPPYNVVNIRASLTEGKWTGTVFCDNLGNNHAIISANNTSFQFNTTSFYRASTNQPLTGGVRLSYRF